MPIQEISGTLRSHRRQFVIGPKAVHPYNDWCSHQLDASTWVSYCPELRAGWTRDADGTPWVLFGLAVETLEDKANPLAEIARTRSADVPDLYASWAERWVLIGRGQVHMDASGLLGCFYGKAPNNQTWVSSSPALLARILSPDALLTVDPRPLHYEVGISWFTPPRSRFAGMYRLLPSQALALDSGDIRPRPLMPPIDPARGYDETLDLLKRSLVTAMRQLPLEANKLWLGLTAGFDSRLMLAIARYANIDVMPFTRVSARMSVADSVLPPKLAQEYGYEHIFMRGRKDNVDRKHLVATEAILMLTKGTRRKDNVDRKHLVADHSADHVSDGDALPFTQGVRDSLEGISIGGWCFEVGHGFWDRKFLPDVVTNAEVGAQQTAQAYGEPLTSTATAGIREWLEWVLEKPQEHLDWRDRLYIEQRLAGWLSSKEQLYDLVNLERIPVLNAARNYGLLLGLKENQRLSSLYQVELIRRLAPELLKYPFNPNDEDFGILRAITIKSSDSPLYLYRKFVGKLRWMWRSLLSSRG